MAQAVLNAKARVIPRRTIRKLCKDEIFSEIEKQKRRIFQDLIQKSLGESLAQPEKHILNEYEPYSDDSEPASFQLPEDNYPVDNDGTTDFEKPITDHWIHVEMNLPQGDAMYNFKVIVCATDQDENVIVTYDDNPYSNTMMYDVEFPDGEIKEYSANVIAENMYAQVDAEVFSHSLLDSISDFKKYGNAVDK